jgi:hypothetical protein
LQNCEIDFRFAKIKSKDDMKNTDILPGQLVPEEIRLEIYREALRQLDEPLKYELEDYYLCLLLPCILWELEYYLDDPDSGSWEYLQTKKMFPEIQGIEIEVLNKEESALYDIRKRYLESAIQTLEKK